VFVTFVVIESVKSFTMIKVLLTVLFSLPLAWVEANDEISGKVIAVIDGNTIEVSTNDDTYKIMFFGIDCPELEQEYGEKAKQFTEKLLINKQVEFKIIGKDRWGTRLAVITIDGSDTRQAILQEGLAWTAEKNSNEELEQIKNEAKKKGRGLWRDQQAVAPWIFRRQQTMLVPKTS
jgi:micrococcal nuclease